LWHTDPLPVDGGHALVSTDAEHLVRFDLTTGNVVWEQALVGWPSLTGAAPQLRRDGSHLLVVVERNYGWELEQRDLATGEPGWRTRLGSDAVDIGAVGLATDVYCVPRRDAIRAYARDTGKQQWDAKLPAPGPWRVQATRSALIACPTSALPLTDVSGAADRAWRELAGVPTVAQFHLAAAILYHAWMRRTFPVRLLDPTDGRELARHDFAVSGPRAALLLGEKHAAVAVEGALLGLRP
jgi:hypothetical protein